MDGGWVIGADLGATKIALGLVDPSGRIVARQRLPTGADEGAQAVVERIAGGVAGLREGLPAGEHLAGLGICCPGPLDPEAGLLLDPPNLPSLHNAPLRPMLEQRLECPVCLEHDARAAALGEFPSPEAAADALVRFQDEILPDPAWQERYDAMAPIFDRLYRHSQAFYDDLDRLLA